MDIANTPKGAQYFLDIQLRVVGMDRILDYIIFSNIIFGFDSIRFEHVTRFDSIRIRDF